MIPQDPHAVVQPGQNSDAPPHDPRVPGEKASDAEHRDHPSKPFRTPNKTKTHPAPERATDGDPLDGPRR